MQSSGFRAKRLATGLAVIGLVAGVVAACVELEGSLGSDCLKDQDCQSGVCSQTHCVAVPPLLDAEPGPDAADAAGEAAQGTPPPMDGSGMTGMDATMPTDATQSKPDAVPPDTGSVVPPTDAPADAIEEVPAPDAPYDAPADALDDARADAGEAG